MAFAYSVAPHSVATRITKAARTNRPMPFMTFLQYTRLDVRMQNYNLKFKLRHYRNFAVPSFTGSRARLDFQRNFAGSQWGEGETKGVGTHHRGGTANGWERIAPARCCRCAGRFGRVVTARSALGRETGLALRWCCWSPASLKLPRAARIEDLPC